MKTDEILDELIVVKVAVVPEIFDVFSVIKLALYEETVDTI